MSSCNFKHTQETKYEAHTVSNIMKNVMVSSTDEEVGAIFYNRPETEIILNTHRKMGHPQLAPPKQTENSTANDIVDSTVRQRLSRATDMHLYWIQDIIKKIVFCVFCISCTSNLGDFFPNIIYKTITSK